MRALQVRFTSDRVPSNLFPHRKRRLGERMRPARAAVWTKHCRIVHIVYALYATGLPHVLSRTAIH